MKMFEKLRKAQKPPEEDSAETMGRVGGGLYVGKQIPKQHEEEKEDKSNAMPPAGKDLTIKVATEPGKYANTVKIVQDALKIVLSEKKSAAERRRKKEAEEKAEEERQRFKDLAQ